MIIEKPSIEIENLDYTKMMKNIEKACRTCYRSEDKITDDSYKTLLSNCLSRGHESVLEHEKITIRMRCDVGCYDDKTYVLTEEGWKLFKDVDVSRKVFTLTDEGEIILYPIQSLIKKEYNDKMYHFRNSTLDLMVTPDHNMWVFDNNKRSPKTKTWKFLQAQDMKNNIYSFNKKGDKKRKDSFRKIIIPDFITNNNVKYNGFNIDNLILFELCGWFITDGSIDFSGSGNSARLRIFQKKDKGRVRIEELLEKGNIPYTKNNKCYNINSPALSHFIAENFYKDKKNKKSYNAFVPDFIREGYTNEIESFIDGVVGGDGTKYEDGTGRIVIYTASEQFAKDLVELYFRIGKTSSYYYTSDMCKYKNSYQQTTPCYCVSVHRTEIGYLNKKYVNKNNESNFEIIDYKGNVYCLVLDNHHRLMTMRNGKIAWCGNCYKDLTRHRIASFSIESSRYCNYNKDKFNNQLHVIEPVFYDRSWIDAEYEGASFDDSQYKSSLWYKSMEDAEEFYNDMIKTGAIPDEARMVLPHSTAATVTMTANLREWKHILELRASKHAHPSVQQVMIPLLLYFKEKMPEIFNSVEYNTEFPKEKYAQIFLKEDK